MVAGFFSSPTNTRCGVEAFWTPGSSGVLSLERVREKGRGESHIFMVLAFIVGSTHDLVIKDRSEAATIITRIGFVNFLPKP
jgi:hypothetical protein